ncbi:ABC transporter ATP-binding protein [Desulfobacca acetoxidans]|uniref:Polyamine-transporting ATPase n=1 Tax=Desulfobacca acetoxidans (strain ATCC 700848 / DSM 11109 / ASRB2) TaxID=880072 RepID=F2NH80_DESAR|nr:ATP-binding cassette domain-containing protein [Desulfobacca acetoxidans]AEB08922.1 Polyamine-transporting ATPase [Desulfobacca acetoxidans DSM 11109]
MGLAVQAIKRVNGFKLEVDWQIGNELAVLFGYSGAGKSLTLQLIAGFLQPDTGRITANGQVLFDSRMRINVPPQRRSLGYVFQDLALFPHMTVRQNIAYGATGLSRTEREQRVEEMLHIFHLEGLARKPPAEISGGQKQRVALARALIRRPQALLLDEPFSALDNPLRREMRRFLKQIHREFALPVILVTHDLLEATSLADTLLIYTAGKIAQRGSPQAIISQPRTPEVAALVASYDGQSLQNPQGDENLD